MTTDTCPTCGSTVRVVSSDEGTSYYEAPPVADEAGLRERAAAVRAMPSLAAYETLVDDLLRVVAVADGAYEAGRLDAEGDFRLPGRDASSERDDGYVRADVEART